MSGRRSETRERTTPTFCKCWGSTQPFGLNVYGRAFWKDGPHVRWQFMWWVPGVSVCWGNAALDFRPLTPEDEVELMGWGVRGHVHQEPGS
jgi:hypothetical protein